MFGLLVLQPAFHTARPKIMLNEFLQVLIPAIENACTLTGYKSGMSIALVSSRLEIFGF